MGLFYRISAIGILVLFLGAICYTMEYTNLWHIPGGPNSWWQVLFTIAGYWSILFAVGGIIEIIAEWKARKGADGHS